MSLLSTIKARILRNSPPRWKVGDVVCDCQFKHQRIVEIDWDDDTAILEDGSSCSPRHCLDPVPHAWEHWSLS